MELKLEHLQAYPLGKDGIKVILNEDGLREIWDIDEDMTHTQNQYYIKSIDFDLKVLQLISVVDERYSLDEMELKWVSLVVLPLSNLTKEERIEFNKITNSASSKNILPPIESGRLTNLFLSNRSLVMFNWLFSKHFDLFNLIENGLAIDVNTLQPSPNQQLTK